MYYIYYAFTHTYTYEPQNTRLPLISFLHPAKKVFGLFYLSFNEKTSAVSHCQNAVLKQAALN